MDRKLEGDCLEAAINAICIDVDNWKATSPIVSFPSQLLTISIIEERVAWLEELGTIKNATDLVVGALLADGKHWCTLASIFGRGHT
ncbi:hypothetical protein F444_03165, partial [Phytophthora nicotianae P1976]